MARNEVTVWIRAKNAAAAGLRSAQMSFKKFAANVKKYALGISAALGLSIAGIVRVGASLVKAASTAEETAGKFATTFRAVRNEAEAMAKVLSRSYGLSRQESKKLLSDTGDLLSGFGFSGKAALDLSAKVNKLAIDLASFANIEGGAQAASTALTKGLLGETEAMVALGIKTNQQAIAAKVLEMAERGLTFATEQQAKAYATLEIAMGQSANAQGDFARTQDSLANQWRILSGHLADIAADMGKAIVEGGKLAKVLKAINDGLGKDGQDPAAKIERTHFWMSRLSKINLGPVFQPLVNVGRLIKGAVDLAPETISKGDAADLDAHRAERARREQLAKEEVDRLAKEKAAKDALAAADAKAAQDALHNAALREQALVDFNAEAERFRENERKWAAERIKNEHDVANAAKAGINEAANAAQAAQQAELGRIAARGAAAGQAAAQAARLAGVNVAAFIAANRNAAGKVARLAGDIDEDDEARAKKIQDKLDKRGGNAAQLNKRDREFMAAKKARELLKFDQDVNEQAQRQAVKDAQKLRQKMAADQVAMRASLANIEKDLKANLTIGGTL